MTELLIKEMSCNHCVQRINNLLEEMKVEHMIFLETKTVVVDTSRVPLDKIMDELDDIGFTASLK